MYLGNAANEFQVTRLTGASFIVSTPKRARRLADASVDPIDARRGIRNPDKLSARTARTFAPRLQKRGITPSKSTR
jgi:hypothetical protein